MSQYPATVEVYPTAQGQLVQKPRHHLVVDESLVSEVIAHLLLILRGALVGTFSRVRASNLEATPFRDLNVRKTTNYFVCYTFAAGLGTSGEILTLAFMCSVGSVRVMIRATMFCCSFSRRYIYIEVLMQMSHCERIGLKAFRAPRLNLRHTATYT